MAQRLNTSLKQAVALPHSFANRASSLLDFACGRGGDLRKWSVAKVCTIPGRCVVGAGTGLAWRQQVSALETFPTLCC
jgi:hypothetical protein